MGSTRREFLGTGIKAGAAASLLGATGLQGAGLEGAPPKADREADAGSPQARRALRILILGGTGVTGPHLVREALERGHQVTIFTRGRTEPSTNAGYFDRVEKLVGDRADNLTALETGSWDVCIDNSGQQVEWTTASAELLRDRVGTYVYTSSTGVFFPYLTHDIDEDTEVLMEIPESASEDERFVYQYGVMKANSEAESRRIFGEDRALILRPTYIMGPGDVSDRFTYWPVRIAQGGEVLVPGGANDPVQYIDNRDIARFALHLLENGTHGTFNLAGPERRMGMHAFVHGVHAAFSSPVDWVYANDMEFLMEQEVMYSIPWIMPWGNNWGSPRVDNTKALEAGLTFRPLAESCRDLYEWWTTSDSISEERRERMAGGLMAREAEIIAAWKTRERGE